MGSLRDLEPGRYKATISDYGLTEVEKLNQLKAFIKLEITSDTGNCSGTFECFVKTKDGQPNKKLLNTLVTCGFKSDDLADLNKQGMLDMAKEYEATVIQDGEYKRIEWINDPSKSNVPKVTDVKKLQGLKFTGAFKEARGETTGGYAPTIPNRTDEVKKKLAEEAEETIPF